MRYFFRAYTVGPEMADKFFDKLDKDGSGEVDYREFLKLFGPYIQPGHSSGGGGSRDELPLKAGERTPSTEPGSSRGPSPACENPAAAARDEELRKICSLIGDKVAMKFSHARDAFRFVDVDHDGTISRSEMRYFFRHFNVPDVTADRFF